MEVAPPRGSRSDDAPGRYRLVRPMRVRGPIEPSDEQRAVIAHGNGRLKVLAGPGTGKTTTLVEAIADRVERRGIDPSSLLVLTFSRRAAAELSARVAERLETTTTEPLVRTLHSFAYAVARNAAVQTGEPPPRLLEAGQADLMVRDVLAGHAEEGGRYWPQSLRPALRMPSFASELRELMLRAAELGISSRRIAALGRGADRPEWVAVADFINEYRQIGDLRQATTGQGSKLDQAELTAAALECLSEPATLAAHRSRIRRVLVDEYQDVDTAQAALIDLLAAGADELIVVGDPDQSIYGFRGAEANVMSRIDTDEVINLTVSRRLPATLTVATRRVAARLPGPHLHRQLRLEPPVRDGTLEVRTLANVHQEAALVADRIRRLHVESGIAYSSMAVLMRAPVRGGDVFRRALAAVGVPVTDGGVTVLSEQPLVVALLSLLRIAVNPGDLDGDVALSLLASPLGQLDVLALRRLRRAVRRDADGDENATGRTSAELIADILRGSRPIPAGLANDVSRSLHHLRALVAIAIAGARESAAETVLWRLWQESGLAESLAADWERGSERGRQAGDHLDAVIALFDRAADLAAQLPSAGVSGLLDLIADETVSAAAPPPPDPECVAIMSAHAAKGLEWDVVAVAGVQDDTWPDLRPRTSLLRSTELFDAAAGIGLDIPTPSPLTDERRLFYVAATRARKHLIVTAVDNAETSASRFLGEIAGGDDAVQSGWPRDRHGSPQRTLNMASLVAELRAAAEGSPAGDEAAAGAPARSTDSRAVRAASLLAVLAREKVRGADPAAWYGLADVTTDRSLLPDGGAVTLSPSQIESAMECPLRTALSRHGGRADPGQAQLVGIAVHALAEGMAVGASPADIDTAVEEFLAGQDQLPPWEIVRLRTRMQSMRDALEAWLDAQSASRTFLGSELTIDISIPDDAGIPIRLRGRIDWLSTDRDGRVVITDFKTGATVPSVADAQSHPQLAVYQLAVALGALAEQVDKPAFGAGGAELVYVSTGKAKVRSQSPQTPELRQQWLDRLRDVAVDSVGPTFEARQGEYCARCPVRSSCPLQPEGRQVGQ